MAYNYEYPYTDASRVNDDWLLNKMKELLEAWDVMGTRFADLNAAWEEMKVYIQRQFSEMNLQAEVNKKLDIMAGDGTLANLLAPFVAGASNPIIVSSIGDMTDTNKIYVLAPGGHMYTYRDAAWTDTGLIFGDINSLREIQEKLDKQDKTLVTYDKVTALFQTAEAYLLKSTTAPEGENILYEEGTGIYAESLHPEGRQELGCSCSEFVMAVLNGVQFEDSRYNSANTKNHPAEWGHRSGYFGAWTSYGDFLTADEFKRFYADYLEDTVVSDGTLKLNDRIKPGDILIWEEESGRGYHIGITVQTRGNRIYYLNATAAGESSGPGYQYGRKRRGSDTIRQGIIEADKAFTDPNFPSKFVKIDHVITEPCKSSIEEFWSNDRINKHGTITGSTSVWIYSLRDRYLEPGFYTLELESEGEIAWCLCKTKYTNLEHETQGADPAFNEQFTFTEGKRGHFYFRFYADCPIEDIEFRLQGPGSYDVKKITIWKGIKPFDN